MKSLILIGYSGHAFVVTDILERTGSKVIAFCDAVDKYNPFNLTYLGDFTTEKAQKELQKYPFFISIGNNNIREKIYNQLIFNNFSTLNAIDPSAIISNYATIGQSTMIGAGAKINAFATIGNAVICNTGSIIEHECQIADFVHLAPGAVLCGDVKIGQKTFVGANTVVKQGISIGKNTIIGAGSVVLQNIPDNCTAVGNPCKVIKKHVF
jgi:sugar O-acyltransferase (sialic acid O-acetyltransferase NeuD family)